jgi:hypothetical protein
MTAADLRLLADTTLLTYCCVRIAEGIAIDSTWRPSVYAVAALLTVVSALTGGRS